MRENVTLYTICEWSAHVEHRRPPECLSVVARKITASFVTFGVSTLATGFQSRHAVRVLGTTYHETAADAWRAYLGRTREELADLRVRVEATEENIAAAVAALADA